MAAVRAISMHYNTVYAVEAASGLILIDTGPDYRGAWAELRKALGPRQPDLVIATHGHNDHASLGAMWQGAGVPVIVGAGDVPVVGAPGLHQPGELEALKSFARSCGAPAEIAKAMEVALQRRYAANASAGSEEAYNLPASRWPTALRFVPFRPDFTEESANLPGGLELIRCPGHTPGNLVVVERNEGWLFSGDQLLPEMTATPGIQFVAGNPAGWRFHSLPAFLESLRRLSREGFTMCFPGHGGPFSDVQPAIERNIAVIESRTDRVASVLDADRPATPWTICERLYRHVARRRPWQLLATVQGHLDLLEARGLAQPSEGGWLAT